MLPNEAYDLIKSFEGYLRKLNDGTDRVRPYLCPARVATVGWGSTRYFSFDGAVAIPQGRVKMTDEPITRDRAFECFRGELYSNELAFDRYTVSRVHPMMRGAIVSFIYNCGEGAYKGSTLRRVINKGEWNKVPAQLAKWRMGGGVVLAGLVRRRKAEAALFMQGVKRLQSGVDDTPITPQPAPPPPVAKQEAPIPAPAPAPKGWWKSVVDWIFR